MSSTVSNFVFWLPFTTKGADHPDLYVSFLSLMFWEGIGVLLWQVIHLAWSGLASSKDTARAALVSNLLSPPQVYLRYRHLAAP